MVCTEKEARAKECRRVGFYDSVEYEWRFPDCIASLCMVWEWEHDNSGCVVDGENDPCLCVLEDPQFKRSDCSYAKRGMNKNTCGFWKERTTGYCGLSNIQG